MKLLMLAFSILCLTCSLVNAQTDTLPHGVYNIAKKLNGTTKDLSSLRTHISTLQPGKMNHPPRALTDIEELIIVKEGQLKVMINDSAKTLGAGSIVFIQAGDVQSFQNTSDAPVTYYVISFKSKLPVNLPRGKEAGGAIMKEWSSLTVKKTAKGESRPVFDRPTSMFPRFEIHSTTLNSGEDSHPAHTHRAEEIIILMKGSITSHIAGKDYPVGLDELVLLTADIPHNLTNTGSDQCQYFAFKWFN